MVTNAIVPFDPEAAVEGVRALAVVVRELREKVFVQGQDFGTIPGTGQKPVLLLPGMEKLMRALRLRPEYGLLSEIQDFEKPLFYFRYECRLVEVESGDVLSSAIGSANSMESKWRWREAKRTCPKCGAETINRSKFPPKNNPQAEPGWYCYSKIGGCGAEFAANDPAITGQSIGRVENPDIFDQINTIDKIAQKRALASAIKGAANVSEFFTVDLEDLPPMTVTKPLPDDAVEGEFSEEPTPPPARSLRSDAERLGNGGDRRVSTTTNDGVAAPSPAREARSQPEGPGGAGQAPQANNVTQFPANDWDAIFKATEKHFGEDSEAGRRAHFKNLVSVLRKSGDLKEPATDAEVVAAINANREAEGKANAGWWTDKVTTSNLGADVWAEFGLTLEEALGMVAGKLSDYASPNAVLDAVRVQQAFKAI